MMHVGPGWKEQLAKPSSTLLTNPRLQVLQSPGSPTQPADRAGKSTFRLSLVALYPVPCCLYAHRAALCNKLFIRSCLSSGVCKYMLRLLHKYQEKSFLSL